MRSANCTDIQKEFTKQANVFESARMNFSKKEYLKYAISKISPKKTDNVLEFASGTCVCGRAVAPFVSSVTCLDLTPAMLAVGKAKAERENIDNIRFIVGDAAELPFPDNCFDVVLSRLAFHHFPDIEQPFSESVRVLKPGGKLVLADMETAEEPLRRTRDRIEKLRDPSHVRNLSREEMTALFREHGLTVTLCESVEIPTVLSNWLEHTQTPEPVQNEIIKLMKNELAGGQKTGFAPYMDENEIKFRQRWTMLIGINPDGGMKPNCK